MPLHACCVAVRTLGAPAAGACCAVSNCARHSLASSDARASEAVSAAVVSKAMEPPLKDRLRAESGASSASRLKEDLERQIPTALASIHSEFGQCNEEIRNVVEHAKAEFAAIQRWMEGL